MKLQFIVRWRGELTQAMKYDITDGILLLTEMMQGKLSA
jgi:hypothetical protein